VLELMAQRMRGYFRRRMRDAPQDVEDLVQETLLAVHLHRDTFESAMPVTVWLHAIARHKLIDLWRRQGRDSMVLLPVDDIGELEHPAASDAGEPTRDLALLLERLPAAQRRSIIDTKIQGLTVAEAAQSAGVSEASVKVNVHRGLRRLALFIRSGR
jgi:RNA polymerase sigma-70 factor (ECF subfamily)